MNKSAKPFNSEPTPLVSLFVVVTSLLCAIFIYQKFFNSGVIDFTPAMTWVAIAIPAGICGSIFLQMRSTQRTTQGAQKSQNIFPELEVAPRGNDPRRAQNPTLDRPLPEKDPFENL